MEPGVVKVTSTRENTVGFRHLSLLYSLTIVVVFSSINNKNNTKMVSVINPYSSTIGYLSYLEPVHMSMRIDHREIIQPHTTKTTRFLYFANINLFRQIKEKRK